MSDKKIYIPLQNIENILPILNKISIFASLTEKQLFFFLGHLKRFHMMKKK